MTRRLSLLLLPLILFSGVSCSKDPASPAQCTDETTSVDARVTVGASVVFDWTPRCQVALILVEQADEDLWYAATFENVLTVEASANVISAPVTYGQLPQGATNSIAAEALTPGVTYELILYRIAPSGSATNCEQYVGRACRLALKTFVR